MLYFGEYALKESSILITGALVLSHFLLFLWKLI